MASIPLVEGRHALRGEKPNRSTLKQGCGGCRDRSEFKNRTEQNRAIQYSEYDARPRDRADAQGMCVSYFLVRILEKRANKPKYNNKPKYEFLL